MKSRLLFLLLIPMQFLLSEPAEEKFSEGPAPAWINRCDFSLEPIPPKPTQVNVQYLLSDMQHNWEEKTIYCHFAMKALSQDGIRDVAQINIDFDPSYETVVTHGIRVFRNGEWQERMHSSRRDLLQRESHLESDIYNGDLTLVYFLDDIREGDIIEYAYSLVGSMPFYASHCTVSFRLQNEMSIERLYRRLLAHPDRAIAIKSFHTTMDPQILDLSPTLRQYSWEVLETTPCPYETDRPTWYSPYARVTMSEYQTWREVIEKESPLYILPADVASEEMAALVGEWKEISRDDEERVLLALRFVQDKIRYFGFEEGFGGHKPRDPQNVLLRRLGDCKDKAFLLFALLYLMDIPSTPVLVHTRIGKNLSDSLPSPYPFDHVVLRVEINGVEYWVDPTMSRQGGSSLRDNFFPDYDWGLPISQSAPGLIALPSIAQEKPIEIHTSFLLTSEDTADLKIVWTFHGFNADFARGLFEGYGLKKITENNLDRIQKMYGGAALISPVSIIDDRKQNILTMTESYQIPIRRRFGKQKLKVASLAIGRYLDSNINPERSSPYALLYPRWVKEHIHIENPFFDLGNMSNQYTYEHESLRYSHSLEVSGGNADLKFELQHLKDHVPTSSLRDYWEITSDIEQDSLFNMTISEQAGV